MTSPKLTPALLLAALLAAALLLIGAGNAQAALSPPELTDTPPAEDKYDFAQFMWGRSSTSFSSECTLDSVAIACNSGSYYNYKTLYDLTEGEHTFAVRFVSDTDTSSWTSYTWKVDLTRPTATMTSAPPQNTNSRDVSFAWTYSESGVSGTCYLYSNGTLVSPKAPCDRQVSYSLDADGDYTLFVDYQDPAGNYGSFSLKDSFTLDTVAPAAPEVKVSIFGDPSIRDGDMLFWWKLPNDRSPRLTTNCAINGAPTAICNGPDVLTEDEWFYVQVSMASVPAGEGTWQVSVTDEAGNSSPAATANFSTGGSAPTPTPPKPLPAACGTEGAPGYLYPAKTRVLRSTVDRSARVLDMLAPITSRARGAVKVKYEGDRRTKTFSAKVTSGNGDLDRIRFRERLTRGQAALGQGIVTLYYMGDADTRPEEVRLRAANGQAKLNVEQISLLGANLSAKGKVTTRAEGVVRFRYSYLDAQGKPQTHIARAKIQRNGSWALKNDQVPAQLAQCGGYLSILFTGYFPERIRGEMLAYELNAGQTRRP